MKVSLSQLKKYYTGSPYWVKKLYSSLPWSIRMGKGYRDAYSFLASAEHYSAEQWRVYQTYKLKELLVHCEATVPYYKALFSDKGIDVNASNIWVEFEKIPLLDKQTVLSDIDAFLSNKFRKKSLYSATTGGTTGKPMQIFYDSVSYKKEWAFKIHAWNKAIGYQPSSRKATFRGVASGNALWVENPIYNEIRFSPFHMVDESLKDIVDKLVVYKPKFVHGYPSAIAALSSYLIENNLKIASVKAVMFISENILDGQRRLVQEAFGCEPYSFYGHSERALFASMKADLNEYHSHPAYGVCELVDDHGAVIKDCGLRGELVGTGFINPAMPLLRYRAGDYCMWSNVNSDNAGYGTFPVVEGRWKQEFVEGRDGKRVSLTALNMHEDLYAHIDAMQYVVGEQGLVDLNIIPAVSYEQGVEEKILAEYRDKLGDTFTVQVSLVDSLIKTKIGKCPLMVKSRVDRISN